MHQRISSVCVRTKWFGHKGRKRQKLGDVCFLYWCVHHLEATWCLSLVSFWNRCLALVGQTLSIGITNTFWAMMFLWRPECLGERKSTAGCCPTASVLVGAKHREARGGRLVLFYVSCKKYLSVCNSGNCLVNEKSKWRWGPELLLGLPILHRSHTWIIL